MSRSPKSVIIGLSLVSAVFILIFFIALRASFHSQADRAARISVAQAVEQYESYTGSGTPAERLTQFQQFHLPGRHQAYVSVIGDDHDITYDITLKGAGVLNKGSEPLAEILESADSSGTTDSVAGPLHWAKYTREAAPPEDAEAGGDNAEGDEAGAGETPSDATLVAVQFADPTRAGSTGALFPLTLALIGFAALLVAGAWLMYRVVVSGVTALTEDVRSARRGENASFRRSAVPEVAALATELEVGTGSVSDSATSVIPNLRRIERDLRERVATMKNPNTPAEDRDWLIGRTEHSVGELTEQLNEIDPAGAPAPRPRSAELVDLRDLAASITGKIEAGGPDRTYVTSDQAEGRGFLDADRVGFAALELAEVAHLQSSAEDTLTIGSALVENHYRWWVTRPHDEDASGVPDEDLETVRVITKKISGSVWTDETSDGVSIGMDVPIELES